MNEAIRMQLSAFVDGELPENEAELLLRRLSQDAELRQQVAQFMAIGRAMRGEVQVRGIDRLRSRVTDEIDVELPMAAPAAEPPAANRLLRPLAGFAIAATVALVAIFGLRQTVDNIDDEMPSVADDDGRGYTQQQPEEILEDELLREMRRMHDVAASDQSINTRLTALEIRQQLVDEEADEEVDEEAEADDVLMADPAAGQ